MAAIEVKSENGYGLAFRDLLAKSEGPSWLTKQREEAFGQFEHGGFPTLRDED